MSAKAGSPPGTLIHVGEQRGTAVSVELIQYDQGSFSEATIEDLEVLLDLRDESRVSWVNVNGVHDVGILERIGQCFGLHPLVLEDILNTKQRPKIDDMGEYIFVILTILSYEEESGSLGLDQLSLILGPDFVISFQEGDGEVFGPIRERIGAAKGRIRREGADYLLYALIDAVVDNYFVVLEEIGERVESLEEELVTDPAASTLHGIHDLKRQAISLRRSVWPLREVIHRLERGDLPLVRESTQVYLRDVYDHTIQVMDTVEGLRDMLSGMLDIYLSSISNRMNEIMKVLTIIATLFIPVTFVAGIYGMNFKVMPELDWRWGYPFFWLVVVVIAALMLAYFRRRKWL